MKTGRSICAFLMLAVFTAVLCCAAFGDNGVEGLYGGPGVRYNENGQLVTLDGHTVGSAELSDAPGPVFIYREGTGTNGVSTYTEGGKTVYSFEGKQYVKKSSWGEHYLTGYCPSETGSRITYSGREGKAHHTVSASSQLPIGTVIIIEGLRGHDFSDWDGVYIVEDRGGKAVEKGTPSTNNAPVVDIFFDTLSEALNVTNAGFVTAHIWIAEEVR